MAGSGAAARDEAASPLPRVTYFAMGANEWRQAQDWPHPATQPRTLFLDAATCAPPGTGLSAAVPAGAGTSPLPVDPADPVPTLGGRLMSSGDTWLAAGPVDQRPNERRGDVLSFTTAAFETATEVTGHLALELWLTFDSPSADVAATVTDVFPDGRSMLLVEGITRVTAPPARDGFPGPTPSRVDIDLSVTSNVFRAGHRLRVNVAASNFPRYDLNRDVFDRGTSGFVLHTGREHPSRLVVPVIGDTCDVALRPSA